MRKGAAMRKMWKQFMDKIGWALLLVVLTPLAASIGSRILSGEWLAWLSSITSLYTLGFGSLCLMIGFVWYRISHLNKQNLPKPRRISVIHLYGYRCIGKLTYKDVKWVVQVPNSSPCESLFPEETKDVSVKIHPLCPKCETEIEETKTFFGSYLWTCINCGYKTKNDISYVNESVRAENLAKSRVEKENFDEND